MEPAKPYLPSTPWDERFAGEAYTYGTEPNAFLRDNAERLPAGRVLSLAEGEGRNAAFLAGRGHAVTAVDLSAVGLAKARRLAAARGVAVETVQADLTDFTIEPEAWDGIVSFFCHLPAAARARLHAGVVAGLRPGGVFLLEAYAPRQIEFDSGGPRQADLLMPVDDLRRELAGLDFLVARECLREVVEGDRHTGLGAVVQICAVKLQRPGG